MNIVPLTVLPLLLGALAGCKAIPGEPPAPSASAPSSAPASPPQAAAAAPEVSSAAPAPATGAADLPSPVPAALCDAQVAELERWLSKLLSEGSSATLGATLPPSVDRKANGWWRTDAIGIVVDDRLALIDGTPVAPTRLLPDRRMELLDALTEKARLLTISRGPGAAGPISHAVIATPTVPWRAVAAVAAAIAGSGSDTAWFVFAGKSELSEPGSPLNESFRPLDPTAPVPMRPPPSPPVFGRCQQVPDSIQSALAGTDSFGPREKLELFAARVPAGLRACGCAANMNDVKALMWSFANRFEGPAAHVARVKLGSSCGPSFCRKPGELTLSRPADAPWSEAAEAVLAAADSGKPHVFAAE